MEHRSREELEAGLDHVRAAPADGGALELIARRPAIGERELLASAQLDPHHGLLGDNWRTKGSRSTPDGSSDPDKQITLMNARVADLLAGSRDRWAEAGDQLYVDLDIGVGNLPPGTRLELGTAVIEITDKPHTGCAKFAGRFGREALRFVNSPEGTRLRLRGVNARVVAPGTVSLGDRVVKSPVSVDGS